MQKPAPKKWHFDVSYVLFAVIGLLLFQQVWSAAQQVEITPYSEFLDLLHQGKVQEVQVSDTGVNATLKEPLPSGRKTIYSVRVQPDIARDLEAAHVKFSGTVQNTWISSLLSWIVPVAFFFLFWSFLSRRMGQGFGPLMSIGQSRARVFVEKDVNVGFADVAG